MRAARLGGARAARPARNREARARRAACERAARPGAARHARAVARTARLLLKGLLNTRSSSGHDLYHSHARAQALLLLPRKAAREAGRSTRPQSCRPAAAAAAAAAPVARLAPRPRDRCSRRCAAAAARREEEREEEGGQQQRRAASERGGMMRLDEIWLKHAESREQRCRPGRPQRQHSSSSNTSSNTTSSSSSSSSRNNEYCSSNGSSKLMVVESVRSTQVVAAELDAPARDSHQPASARAARDSGRARASW